MSTGAAGLILPNCTSDPRPASTRGAAARISVVIPTLDEAGTIVATLRRLAEQGADEVVVADGGSRDSTVALARGEGVRVVPAPRGRGSQQNRGAAATTGEILLFLHADCWLEPGSLAALRRFVADHPRVPGGCFRMRVEAIEPIFRLIDAAAHLRVAILGIPYGDQGIFATRDAFACAGGFPEIALMEDVFLSLSLRRPGRLALLPARIHVSPRRWHRQGILSQTVRNWCLTLSAACGIPPRLLARFYPIVR
jgi:rSAM/selenodomain-associated transferase 2